MSPKNKSIRIALIAIATTVLTIWGFHFLKGSDLLSRMNSYYAVYDKIEGLQTSAPITIKGYKVGLVGEISYNQAKGGILLVELEINPEIKLPKETVARIFTSDLMSGKSVSLELGHSQDYFAPGDTLPSKVEKDLMEEVNAQVAPLKARVEKIMLSFDSVLVGFQAILNEKTRENLIHSIQSISLTLNTIDRIANQVDGLVTTEKGKLSKILSNIEGISATFSQNSQNISTIIQNFHLISDSLAKANIAGTILKTEETLSQTARLLEKINKGEGTAGKLLNYNQIYNNLESS